MKIGDINDGLTELFTPSSLNNRLILEQYKNEGQLKSTVQHGIAMISQKVTLKGLTVLLDAKLSDGTMIRKGSVAYLKEALLHSSPWAKVAFECNEITGQFIVVDVTYVDFVVPPVTPSNDEIPF